MYFARKQMKSRRFSPIVHPIKSNMFDIVDHNLYVASSCFRSRPKLCFWVCRQRAHLLRVLHDAYVIGAESGRRAGVVVPAMVRLTQLYPGTRCPINPKNLCTRHMRAQNHRLVTLSIYYDFTRALFVRANP